jgi:chromosome segregation ATPase
MDAQTPVMVTMKTLLTCILSGAAILLGGLWVIASFTIGGVRDDVSSIRQSLIQTNAALQGVDKDDQKRSNDINKDLGDQIRELNQNYGDMRIEFIKLGGQFEITNKAVDSLTAGLAGAKDVLNATNRSIESLSSRLGATGKSVESLAIGLSGTNKSMDDLSSRLDKFQAALVSASTQDFDDRRLAPLIDFLKKSGIEEQRIIIVPLVPTIPQVR